MGVSGCGKTTIGNKLAERLALPFYDADDFHPKSNIDKMANGFALNDVDREPWLHTLAANISIWNKNQGAILACSALKEKYRAILSASGVSIQWIFLYGSIEQIRDRLMKREGHYMKGDLLNSQFEILEEPAYAHKFDISISPELLLNQIVDILDQE